MKQQFELFKNNLKPLGELTELSGVFNTKHLAVIDKFLNKDFRGINLSSFKASIDEQLKLFENVSSSSNESTQILINESLCIFKEMRSYIN